MSISNRSDCDLDSRIYPTASIFKTTPPAQGTDKNWHQGRNIFLNGLPTPPSASKAMPGVLLGNNYTTFADQGYTEQRACVPRAYDNTAHQRSASTVASDSQITLAPPMGLVGTSYGRSVDQNSTNTIAPHLQIPESVNKSKGSLAEFAAEITCLFWFETAEALQYAEDLPLDQPYTSGLLRDAIPSVGFRKWVTTIISTTQVGKNVILLALMFIYRLKRFNPTVSGKRGSEFRLLTVALMLGNKFLDDNTYTNKTWAEVSGIPVNEIHIMEVEFLSNMRYDLYASAEKWSEWKAKLGRFGAFYDKASQFPVVDEHRQIPPPVTPITRTISHKLPSPPSSHYTANHFAANAAATNNYFPALPHPLSTVPNLPSSPLRQHHSASPHQLDRKRSMDFAAEQPPAKRHNHSEAFSGQPGIDLPLSRPFPSNSLQVSPLSRGTSTEFPSYPSNVEIPRLDALRVPTTSSTSHLLAPLSIPSSRSMSTVYPATTAYSQTMTPISAIPQSLYQNPIPLLGDVPRHMPGYASTHTSPSNGYHTTTPTLPGLSPSYFLTNRTSPYRPVRSVNTLLIPPPSGALQAPVRHVTTDQIHYQPLSKVNTERHTGLLPMMQFDPWPQSNVSTPLAHHRSYQT